MTIITRESVLSSIFQAKRISTLVSIPEISFKALASSMLPTIQGLVEDDMNVSQGDIPMSGGNASN